MIKNIIKYIPFAIIISLNIISEVLKYNYESIKPFVIFFIVALIVNYLISLKLKIKNYFLNGLTGVSISGALMTLTNAELGAIYLENIITSMYFGLLLVTLIPPLFKLKLFTYEFSESKYPSTIVKSEQFYNINLILNYIWSGLFILAIIFSLVEYNDNHVTNTIIATLIPILLLLIVGIPVTLKLPNYLMQKIGGKPIKFKSIKDVFEAMPYGLNKDKAKGVDTVIQFNLTGKEPTKGYLTIKNQKCTFSYGDHSNPKTTINSDSQLWLDITNKKVSEVKTLLNSDYTIEGDSTIMVKFADMFTPSVKTQVLNKPETITYDYKILESKKIKNIVVFDGGFRNTKFSKTSFMVNNFIDGAKSAGANVEYFKLKDYNIKDCTGCFTCWSKTPGKCIFNDDMTMLRKKYREADLVIFASPVYIFNVSGILKTFMDRLLPVLKPYMLINKQGNIMHPDRYPEKGKQGFIVFSASGFPEVKHNFDGLIGMFRAWDNHNENMNLMGEFYLPASEMLVQPLYANRKELVKDLCNKAGRQIVERGSIDKIIMETIQNPFVSKENFQHQADSFWEILDGVKSYLSFVPKFK